MKNFKTKILAIVMCICMCLSVLTGCSLVVKNTKKDNAKVALKVGDTVITKEELIEDYNRFYQQNSSYFMYYDTDKIMQIFYESVVANKIVLIEAQKLIDDGTLIVTDEDIQGVWDKVFDFVYGQIDTDEKAILSLEGKEEKDYPERLQTKEDSSEKAYKYEAYEFEPVTVKTATGEAYNPDNYKIDDEINALKAYVLKYNTGDEDNKVMVDIPAEELDVRNRAYNVFISDLQFSAKANKKDSSAGAVLKAEVERVYKSYYESMIYTKYQEYINSTSAGVEGKYENQFSDQVIAEKYRKLLNASKESNAVESSYIELVTSSSTDTLILYHNEEVGDLYFTVQHILVKFDDATLDELQGTDGYDVTKDAMFRDYYEQVRASIANDDFIKAMSTSYRDENGYAVKEDDGTGKQVESKIAIGDAATEGTILGEYKKELDTRIAALHASEEYVAMTAEEKVIAEQRVKTILFQEFSWKYSADTGSLVSDKLSGVLGFTINNKANENGSWVKEFAEGARVLLAAADNGDGTYDLGATISPVVSDYGVHLMMLTGVYGKGDVVKTTKIEAGQIVDKTDAEIVSELKKTYISNLTSQSLYEYIYDLVKDELVGDSGTYFADHRNALLKEYNDAKKVKYVNKMSNDELTKAISA